MAEAMGHCVAKSGHLQAFYSRLQRRKGEKIAKVATERKLLERIYHMLKERETFQKIEKMVSYQVKPVLVTGSK